MQTIQVIPAKRWQHTNGSTASLYGAVPWTSQADKPNWQIVTIGYTWQVVDGRGSVTIGLGKMPVKTLEEATAIAVRFCEATKSTLIEAQE